MNCFNPIFINLRSKIILDIKRSHLGKNCVKICLKDIFLDLKRFFEADKKVNYFKKNYQKRANQNRTNSLPKRHTIKLNISKCQMGTGSMLVLKILVKTFLVIVFLDQKNNCRDHKTILRIKKTFQLFIFPKK